MAYQVNKFNGVLQTTVADGTIDSSTDLRFVGKNYAGYGEVQNENFLHLMENFANTTPPPKAINGQIWFDSGSRRLKFYDKPTDSASGKWKVAGGAEVSVSEPAGLQTGEFWWDSSAKQLYAWSGTQYVLVGPAASPELGSSAIATDTIKDNKTPADTHAIIKIIAGGEVVAIVNALEDFSPASSTGLTANFPVIKRGITLINTPSSGETSTEYRFWGTASNSDKLGGFSAADFVKVGVENPFTTTIRFPDPGFYVGGDSDLRVWVENSEDVIIENTVNSDITFRITNGTVKTNVFLVQKTGIIPGNSDTFDLGASNNPWRNVYATSVRANIKDANGDLAYDGTAKQFTGAFVGNTVATDSTVLVNATTKIIGGANIEHRGNFIGAFDGDLTGTATSAQKLLDYSPSVTVPVALDKTSVVVRNASGEINASKFNGTSTGADKLRIDDAGSDVTYNSLDETTWYRTARTTATSLTIAARDASGDIWGNIFHGTATSAYYADLAEKYLADKEYEPGTVVMIGGEKEVTAADVNTRAIGVVSTNPAFMMNKDLEGGTYIALKGRVPCKVTGAVKKGDRLRAGPSGTAIAAHGNYADVFGIALESNGSDGVKVIEAVIL